MKQTQILQELAEKATIAETEIAFEALAAAEQLMQKLFPSPNSRIAAIPAVDRQVDAVAERKPIDVQVGTSRVRNPG